MQLLDIDRYENISRLQFLEEYQHKRPLIVRAEPGQMEALNKWTISYLCEVVGEVVATVYSYPEGMEGDYDSASIVDIPIREFILQLKRGNPNGYYWFNLQNGIFKTNPLFKCGHNPALKALERDYRQPKFLSERELVYAQIVLGGRNNSTKLHYDWGGEAKCFVQVRGRKSVRLLSPVYAALAGLNGIASRKNITASTLDIFSPNCSIDAEVYAADLEEGDILYWPSFWMHSLRNCSELTMSINAAQNELPCNPLFYRHATAVAIYKLLSRSGDLQNKRFKEHAVSLEDEILNRSGETLWDWYSTT